MNLALSDAERRLLGDWARYLEEHFDEIDPYFLQLSREEVAATGRFIAGRGGPIGGRDFANLTMLALVLEGLAADGRVALSETALKDTYERLEALRLSSAGREE